MLLILIPLTFILLSIRKRIDPISLSPSFHIFSFKSITILKDRNTLSMRLSIHQLPLIHAPIMGYARSQGYFLGVDTQRQEKEYICEYLIFHKHNI